MISYQEYMAQKRVFFLFLALISISILFLYLSTIKEDDTPQKVVIVNEEPLPKSVKTVEPEPVKEEVVSETQIFSDEDAYLLAKIAMAEAEGEDIQGKVLVMLVVLNRIDATYFPNTIYDIITQEDDGVYQFSPVIPGGRWYTTEPNDECWEAVRIVESGCYESIDALYFTSEKETSTWHSNNLTFLFSHGGHKFYK